MDLPQPRQYTVNDFQEWEQRDALLLQPKFQRRLVWLDKPKSYLLDSIVRGFPVPPIYIREILDPDRRKTIREVVDGQQRLQTILDFLDDRFVILKSHNDEVGGKNFSELPEPTRRHILKYAFSVVILVAADDADVFRIFERLNSYTLPLKAQEKLNAKYFGRFKKFVFRLGLDHLEFWRSNRVLSNRDIVRMGEAELTSELVVAMLDGLQDKKKSLEQFYREYDDSFPQGKKLRSQFEACIRTIQAIFGADLAESAFRKKALFYSLFCVVYDFLFRLPNSPIDDSERGSLTKGSYASVRRGLNRLASVLDSEAPTPAEAKFIEACARQTDNVAPRRIRHKYIYDAVQSSLRDQ
jgi:hypothetical protein